MFSKITFLLLVTFIISVTPATAIQIEESTTTCNYIQHIESYHLEDTIIPPKLNEEKEVVPIITDDEQVDFTPPENLDADTSSKRIRSTVTIVFGILLLIAVIVAITYGVLSAKCNTAIAGNPQRISIIEARINQYQREYDQLHSEYNNRVEALHELQNSAIRNYNPYEWNLDDPYWLDEKRNPVQEMVYLDNYVGNTEPEHLGYERYGPTYRIRPYGEYIPSDGFLRDYMNTPEYFERIARSIGLTPLALERMAGLSLTMNNIGEVVSIAPNTNLGVICEWYPPIYYELRDYNPMTSEMQFNVDTVMEKIATARADINILRGDLANLQNKLFYNKIAGIFGYTSVVLAAITTYINFDSIYSTINKWKSNYMKKGMSKNNMFAH